MFAASPAATLDPPAAMSWDAPEPDHATTAEVSAAPGWSQTGKGRVRCDGLSEQDRLTSVAMHLWWLATLLAGPFAVGVPIGLWLWRRGESPYVDDQGREVLNFTITQVFLTMALTFTGVGVIVLPVLWTIGAIGVVRGALAAGRHELYRYPMTFRPL